MVSISSIERVFLLLVVTSWKMCAAASKITITNVGTLTLLVCQPHVWRVSICACAQALVNSHHVTANTKQAYANTKPTPETTNTTGNFKH